MTLLLALHAGCGLILDLGEGAPVRDAGSDLDAARPDAKDGAGPQDGTTADGAVVDGASVDRCHADWLADGIIAQYDLDGTLVDALGSGPTGFAAPSDGPVYVRGVCGDAVSFDGSSYVVLPDWTRWAEVRSIDFWVLAPTAIDRVSPRGILSRDATTQDSGGHLSIMRSQSDRISVRVQSNMETAHQEKRCSPALDLSGWVHVGVNVGSPGLELWVNGAPQDVTDVNEMAEFLTSFGCSDDVSTTGTPPTLCCIMAPWVVGASNHHSTEGTTDAVSNFLPEGAVDRLRFSTVRRDFRPAATGS